MCRRQCVSVKRLHMDLMERSQGHLVWLGTFLLQVDPGHESRGAHGDPRGGFTSVSSPPTPAGKRPVLAETFVSCHPEAELEKQWACPWPHSSNLPSCFGSVLCFASFWKYWGFLPVISNCCCNIHISGKNGYFILCWKWMQNVWRRRSGKNMIPAYLFFFFKEKRWERKKKNACFSLKRKQMVAWEQRGTKSTARKGMCSLCFGAVLWLGAGLGCVPMLEGRKEELSCRYEIVGWETALLGSLSEMAST